MLKDRLKKYCQKVASPSHVQCKQYTCAVGIFLLSWPPLFASSALLQSPPPASLATSQVYKRVLDKPVSEARVAGICQRENSFYVDTVRAFRCAALAGVVFCGRLRVGSHQCQAFLRRLACPHHTAMSLLLDSVSTVVSAACLLCAGIGGMSTRA